MGASYTHVEKKNLFKIKMHLVTIGIVVYGSGYGLYPFESHSSFMEKQNDT
jgi:hypothetical protein